MQNPDVQHKPKPEEREVPLWIPPPPPPFGPRAWLEMILDRFGFLLALGVTGVLLLVLVTNSDWLLREPNFPEPVLEGAASAPEAASLTVVTDPQEATVLVDGDSVGVTPLRALSVEPGPHVVSLRLANHARVDTVMQVTRATSLVIAMPTMDPDAALLHLEEQLSEDVEEAEVPLSEAEDPEPPPARDEEAAPPDPPSAPPQQESAARAPPAEPPVEPPAEPAPLLGDLRVTSQPSGASVTLNGSRLGVSPMVERAIEAGTKELTFERDGFAPLTLTVDVQPNQMNEVNGVLTALSGTLRVLARPWGAIYIDGQLHKSESSVWYSATLPPGEHRLRVEHPALGKWDNTVQIVAGEEESVIIDFNQNNQ